MIKVILTFARAIIRIAKLLSSRNFQVKSTIDDREIVKNALWYGGIFIRYLVVAHKKKKLKDQYSQDYPFGSLTDDEQY